MKTFVKFGSGNQLLGILTGDPATSSGPILILPSAGLQPRSGPFRLYVELGQKLAPIGIRTFRFDVPGVGEAPRLAGYDENSATLAAMDALQERHGGSEFVVGGICSAADVGWKAAVNDRRVKGVLMLDGVSFTGPWYHYARNLDRVRRLPHEGLRMVRDALQRLGRKRAGDGMKSDDFRDWPTHDEARQQFAALVARGVGQLWIYTGGFTDRFQHPRQFAWAFGDATRSPHVAMHFWRDCDHTFFARAHRDRLVGRVRDWMVELCDQSRDRS